MLFAVNDPSKALRTYKSVKPVNAVAISPLFEHVILAGGQEAMDAALKGRDGGFETKFFHMIFEEHFADVKGHFGPVNTLAFHPNGKSFATGGEDGFVRLHTLPDSYLTRQAREDAKLEKEVRDAEQVARALEGETK